MPHQTVAALFSRAEDARNAADAVRALDPDASRIALITGDDLIAAPLRAPTAPDVGSGERRPQTGPATDAPTPVGAAPGGLVGALAAEGIPEEDGLVYAMAVLKGAVLLTVCPSADRAAEVAAAMDRHGAEDLGRRAAEFQEMGWTRFDEAADSFGAVQISEDGLGTAPVGPLAEAAARLRAADAASEGPRARIYAGEPTSLLGPPGTRDRTDL